MTRVMTRARNFIWLPAFLVGAALAAALATSAGILLYNSRGLTRAGGVMVTVGVVSLVAGIWMGSVNRDETVTSAARGWMGLLVALLLGAAFAGLWEAMDAFGAAAVAQGIGLALTSALPAYFAGGVWGRMNSFAGTLGAAETLQVFLGGALGMAIGSTAMLGLLGEPVLAVTVFLGAAILASAGARTQGWIFDRVPRRDTLLRVPERPELRFESWLTAVPGNSVRVLWEGGSDRAVDPAPPDDWRTGVASTLDGANKVLFIGVGSWFSVGEGRRWRLFEPDPDVRELASSGFDWSDEDLAGSPVPETPGWTVVVEREVGAAVNMDALGAAGVERVWVGGHRGHFPGSILDEARTAGFSASRYEGTVQGTAGPPRLVPRRDELWCLDRSQSPPKTVAGMEAVAPGVPLGRDEAP